MAGIKEIRRRIKSAKNIKKITRAMEMVAASKMRKAQEKAVAGKIYARIIFEMVGDLAQKSDPNLHPLLQKPKIKQNRQLVVLISTNKGLCGALNANLFRFVENWMKTNKSVTTDFVTVGKKGQPFVVYLKDKLIADFSEGNTFADNVSALARLLEEQYESGQYDEVWVAFSDFRSALDQKPVLKRVLPISLQELIDEQKAAILFDSQEVEPSLVGKKGKEIAAEFSIEPSIEEVLDSLLDSYLEIQLRDAILEAEASEYSARMVAMKNATDNAGELIDGLTLEYNKARQAAITNEILDITTAKIGLEG